MIRCAPAFLAVVLLFVNGGGAFEPVPTVGPMRVQVDGLHNVFRVTPQLFSGSGPDNPKAFAALAKLGIKTIISVDGARPNVEMAKKAGLRYVHIPIGYNRVPRERVLQIARAMHELPGPFYIHCHHGQHRGPAAAAIASLCADEKCTVVEALTLLKSAGTDPRYKSLYESVEKLARPKEAEWKKSLPLAETVRVSNFAQTMVSLDKHFGNLKLARAAAWKTPKDHPDDDPAHEALQLIEHYQELRRLPAVLKKPADFQDWLRDGESTARALERFLRNPKKFDAGRAEMAFKRASTVCNSCHSKYRD